MMTQAIESATGENGTVVNEEVIKDSLAAMYLGS